MILSAREARALFNGTPAIQAEVAEITEQILVAGGHDQDEVFLQGVISPEAADILREHGYMVSSAGIQQWPDGPTVGISCVRWGRGAGLRVELKL